MIQDDRVSHVEGTASDRGWSHELRGRELPLGAGEHRSGLMVAGWPMNSAGFRQRVAAVSSEDQASKGDPVSHEP
jgi:hypothetical protein